LDALKGLAKLITKREASVASSVTHRFKRKINFLQKTIEDLTQKVWDLKGEVKILMKINGRLSSQLKKKNSLPPPLGGFDLRPPTHPFS